MPSTNDGASHISANEPVARPANPPVAARRSTIITESERLAMVRALELARLGPAHGPNPQVGCVLLSPSGTTLSEGHHRGAGQAHAEAEAIASAIGKGLDLRGATAVVSLEPCHHTGRTPPCTEAVVAAGIVRVVYAVSDPNPDAQGGAAYLERRGIQVVLAAPFPGAESVVHRWHHAVSMGRPFVTAKIATSLDGRVSAADGTSQWITSEASREHAHQLRAEVDAIIIGTGTLLADDPSLTARPMFSRSAVIHQPMRIVVGKRGVPEGSALLRKPGGRIFHFATHDPAYVLAALDRREIRHVLVEGGPTLISAFLRAGLVDEIHAYLAPVILGSGLPAIIDVGVGTIARALRWRIEEVLPLEPDVFIRYRPTAVPAPSEPGVYGAEATASESGSETDESMALKYDSLPPSISPGASRVRSGSDGVLPPAASNHTAPFAPPGQPKAVHTNMPGNQQQGVSNVHRDH